MISAALKRDLKEAVAKHGLDLYEDDGMWCMMDANYDGVMVVLQPKKAKPKHLPAKGKYIPAVNW